MIEPIVIHGKDVPVGAATAPGEDHITFALSSKIFTEWVASLDPRHGVSAITVQAVDFRGKPSIENVMFVRFKAKTSKPFEEIAELRGGTVVMLPVLICGGKKYTALVRQARLATGDYKLPEAPAGMVEKDSFGGAAAKEIRQELHLTFTEHELTDMTGGDPLWFSPGLLDEKARFFYAERDVDAETLAAMQDRETGEHAEGEFIKVLIVPLDEVIKHTRDMKALAALYLYEHFQK